MRSKLLLLHGALGSKKQFEPVKRLLGDHFEIYDFSFEGHGGVESDEPFSMQLFTQNVIDYMDMNELEHIDVFGYSMGGYVALNTAIQHPDRIGNIVTLGTKFNWSKESAAQEVRMLNPSKIEEKVPAFAKKLKEEHHPLNWQAIVSKTAEMMTSLSEGAGMNYEQLKEIDHSVIIGIGDQDQMVTMEESKSIADMIPNGELKVLDGVPHPIDKIDSKNLAQYILFLLN